MRLFPPLIGLLCGAALVVGLGPPSKAAPTRFSNGFFLNLNTIRMVECTSADGDITGTGTIVAKNRVLTANHVVYQTKSCTVSGKAVKVVWSDAKLDVAMLSADLGDTAVAQYSCEGFQAYKPYYGFGYAAGIDYAMVKMFPTKASLTVPPDDDYPFENKNQRLLFGAAIAGMSGGPIVDASDGRVVGIINSGDAVEDGLSSRDLIDTPLCTAFKDPSAEPTPSSHPGLSGPALFSGAGGGPKP
jgi:hypothetical protein